VLDEVELFVAGGGNKVFALVDHFFGGDGAVGSDGAVAGFFSEGGIGQDQVRTFAFGCTGQGIILGDGNGTARPDAVQYHVHGAEADDLGTTSVPRRADSRRCFF
jgi:hypothetical protein